MPYDISWMVEGRVIFMRDYGVCTLDELNDAVDRLHSFLDAGDKPVHVIHDNRDVVKHPVSLKALKPAVNKHQKMGWMLYIPNSQASSFIVTVLTKLVNQPSKSCSSIEEAITVLKRLDHSLPEDIRVPMLS